VLDRHSPVHERPAGGGGAAGMGGGGGLGGGGISLGTSLRFAGDVDGGGVGAGALAAAVAKEAEAVAEAMAGAFAAMSVSTAADAAGEVAAATADVSATLEAGAYTRSHSAQLELSLCPTLPNLTNDCVPNVLKLSSAVNQCKPLAGGDRARRRGGNRRRLGRAVQVDPMKPKLKPPGTKRSKLEYDGLLSNHGFKFSLRCYTSELFLSPAEIAAMHAVKKPPVRRCRLTLSNPR